MVRPAFTYPARVARLLARRQTSRLGRRPNRQAMGYGNLGRAAGEIQHHPEVVCVRFSPDGKLLAISDGESDLPHYKLLPTAIILWDVATREEVRWLRGHTNTIWALAFSPDGKTLASGSADQTVKFWDTASGQLRETIVPGESGYQAFWNPVNR